MELDQLIAELSKHPAADVFKAIKANAGTKPVFQLAFNEGHGVGEADGRKAKLKLEGDLATAQAEAKTAKDDLQRYKDENPSTAQLHKEYGDKLKAKDDEIANLRQTHTEEKQSERKEKIALKVRAKVAEKVEDTLAESLTDKRSFLERIRFDEANNLRIMQSGGSQIPFAGDEDAQVAAIADEIVKGVKTDFLKVNIGKGSRRTDAIGGSGGGGGAGGTETPAERFERIRKEAAASGNKAVPNAPTNPREILNKRTGTRDRAAS